jgi:hypothetical protein
MIVLGVILLLVGWLLGVSLLETLGLILLVIGVVLYALGSVRTGGRRWY